MYCSEHSLRRFYETYETRIKDTHEKNMEDLGAHPATAEDIFEDVCDLVDKVLDGDERKRLSVLIEQKKREFYKEYDDCRYRHNGQKAYGVIHGFVKTVKSALNADDQESMKVADFLIEFCFEMQIMLQSFGDPKLSFEQRIQERLKEYYIEAPMVLKPRAIFVGTAHSNRYSHRKNYTQERYSRILPSLGTG